MKKYLMLAATAVLCSAASAHAGTLDCVRLASDRASTVRLCAIQGPGSFNIYVKMQADDARQARASIEHAGRQCGNMAATAANADILYFRCEAERFEAGETSFIVRAEGGVKALEVTTSPR